MEFEENNKIRLGCRHKFCTDCILNYLEEEIKNSRVDPIKCPEKDCFKAKASDNNNNNVLPGANLNYFIFSDDLIKSLVSNNYYEKYLDFKLKLIIEKNKNLTFCPIPNCKGYAAIDSACSNNSSKSISITNNLPQEINKTNNNFNKINNKKQRSAAYGTFVSEDEKNNILYEFTNNENEKLLAEDAMNSNSNNHHNNSYNESNTILNVLLEGQNRQKLICNYNHEFCYKCKNSWNENHCCEKDEELFKYSNENANKLKKCPNCRTWIEKNQGCNHMTCFVCKFEFCWLCMKHCLPDHFNIPGTECYGKQFPLGEMDPQIRQAINDLQNASNFFFVFRLTFFTLEYLHRVYFTVNQEQNNNENNNNNNENINNNIHANNNNINANANNVNNNDENNNIREQNQNINNAVFMNQEGVRRSKCGFFTIIFIILFIFWFIMLFLNGIILFSMFKCLSSVSPVAIFNQTVANRLRNATCLIVVSYLILWFVLYLPGVCITTFWFILSVLYLVWLMITR